MKRATRWLLCATALLLAGCGPSPGATLSPLAHDAMILAFGDSLTFGTGAAAGEDWPSRLAAASGREVVNRGVPGETSTAGRARLPGVLAEVQPDLLILTHGGNDLLRQMDRAVLTANLEAMIAAARGAGVEVLLVAVPEPTLLRLRSAGLYAEVAAREEVALEGDVIASVLGQERLRADRAHPNADGYREIARAIESRLRAAGAL